MGQALCISSFIRVHEVENSQTKTQSLGELGFNTSDVPGELFTISACPKFDHARSSTYSAWMCLAFEEVCLQLVAHLTPRSRHDGRKREHLSTDSRHCRDNFLDDEAPLYEKEMTDTSQEHQSSERISGSIKFRPIGLAQAEVLRMSMNI